MKSEHTFQIQLLRGVALAQSLTSGINGIESIHFDEKSKRIKIGIAEKYESDVTAILQTIVSRIKENGGEVKIEKNPILCSI